MDEKIALKYDNDFLTYEQLSNETSVLAQKINETAFFSNIAFQLNNPFDMALVFLASLKTSCRVFLMHPDSPKERSFFLLNRNIPVISSLKELCPRTLKNNAVEDCKGTFVFPTSNTVSIDTHWVEIPMKYMKIKSELLKERLNINENDYCYHISPLCFIQSCWALLIHIMCKATVELAMFSPDALTVALASGNVTDIVTVPSVANYIAKSVATIGNLRLLVLGGDFASRELIDSLKMRWPKLGFANVYGCTETAAADLIMGPVELGSADDKCYSIGTPNKFSDVCIRNEQMQEVKTGETGTIWVNSPFLCSNYLWGNPKQDNGKYGFNTGDIGYRDADGFFYYIGRNTSFFKTNGMKVSSLEIEYALLKCSEIDDAVVFPVKDLQRGYFPYCLVVVNKLIAKQDLCYELKKYIEPYKVPKRFYICYALPKTVSGKKIRNPDKLIASSVGVLE